MGGASFTDFKIVESHFAGVAGVKSHAPVLIIFGVGNRGNELSVDVKVELSIADSDLDLIRAGAGANRARRGPIADIGFVAALVQNDLVFWTVAVVDQKT